MESKWKSIELKSGYQNLYLSSEQLNEIYKAQESGLDTSCVQIIADYHLTVEQMSALIELAKNDVGHDMIQHYSRQLQSNEIKIDDIKKVAELYEEASFHKETLIKDSEKSIKERMSAATQNKKQKESVHDLKKNEMER